MACKQNGVVEIAQAEPREAEQNSRLQVIATYRQLRTALDDLTDEQLDSPIVAHDQLNYTYYSSELSFAGDNDQLKVGYPLIAYPTNAEILKAYPVELRTKGNSHDTGIQQPHPDPA